MAKDKISNKTRHPETLAIPDFAGAQTVTTKYQRRTQLQYISLALLGLLVFYKSPNKRLRVAGLSVLFPGAGFFAVGGIGGTFGALISIVLLPLSLFAWFGAGGLGFVLANWFAPSIIAALCVGDTIWERAPFATVPLVTLVVVYALVKANGKTSAAVKLRNERNQYLQTAEQEWETRVQNLDVKPSLKRELSLREVRLLQRFVEIGLQSPNDWSGFNVIDQFQTSALRYQLYDMQYTLAFVQKYYLPSFQGYVKVAQEQLIEKSLTTRVMNYWKWESLWGKFTFDWDPVVKDNIMVTGYLLLCLALYEKLNGDKRYAQEKSLKFEITKKRSYRHNTGSIMRALMQNWNNSAYCLFPCEPNWIYSGCNLIGMQGALAYDSYMHSGQASALLQDEFRTQFEREFMNPDGSIVALRSSMTGFPVPGIAGIIGDVGGAITCTAAMPLLARRLWHVSRSTTVRKDDVTGKWTLENLVGADNMDVGSYKAGPGFAWSLYAACAGEFGEEDLKHDLLEHIDTVIHPIEAHKISTGSLKNRDLSLLGSGFLFRAHLMRKDDWANLINDEVDATVANGPKLASVPFPELLVARCATTSGRDLSFVLYEGLTPGSFSVKFSNLLPGMKYSLNADSVVADANGEAEATVAVSGRTAFELVIASN